MLLPPFLRRFAFSSHAPQTTESIQEQINPTYIASSPTQEDWYWGRLATGDEEDFWWRRLSDNWYQKDVLPSTYLELHNMCYEAYNANPLAFAIIEITTSFVLGKGVTVAASLPEAQRVLMDFWNDPDNHMETRVYALCTELALYGEQFIRFFVNPYNGRVKIRQIDPSIIDEIETDPEDRFYSKITSARDMICRFAFTWSWRVIRQSRVIHKAMRDLSVKIVLSFICQKSLCMRLSKEGLSSRSPSL